MNLRKHVAGFVIFSIILGGAIFINAYLTAPTATVPPVSTSELIHQISIEEVEVPEPVNFKVRLVSLDFINRQSYTALKLKREAGQPAPERLWITTVFFLPDRGFGKLLTSNTEILKPFVNGDIVEYVAASSCDWCESANIPRAGYFARVYVSANYADSSYLPDINFDFDIKTATPVVVQDKRKTIR